MTHITVDVVIKYVRQSIAEYGDDHVSPLYYYNDAGDRSDGLISDRVVSDDGDPFASTGCRYVAPDGKPECIVGQVLAKAGVPVGVLSMQEGASARTLFDRTAITEFATIDENAHELLTEFQYVQDASVPWGFMFQWYREHGADMEGVINAYHSKSE